MNYRNRTAEKEILNLTKNFKVILVTGMRQVGKTTLLKKIAGTEFDFVTLDNIEELSLAQTSPRAFFKDHTFPLIIDEVQRAPNLFLSLKEAVDEKNGTGYVWLTGSQRFQLMQKATESLAGRLFELELLPFSLYEQCGLGAKQLPYIPSEERQSSLPSQSPEKTFELIWQGAWPNVIDKNGKEREQFFSGLVTSYLEKDIATSALIDKLTVFRRFLKLLASRIGQELRINSLARDCEISEPTVKKWLSIACASGIIYLLPPFYSNRRKQLVKTKKLYFTDTGLAAYLSDITSPEELQRHPFAGAFFENFVIMEIIKSWYHNGLKPEFFFYRDSKTGREIDFIIHRDGVFHPIEIKKTTDPLIKHVANFHELNAHGVRVGLGALICLTNKKRHLSETVIAHSIWDI